MNDLAVHYLDEIKRQLRGHKRMAEAAMAQLEDKEFFVTTDLESNPVAVLVKHIAGNGRSRFTDFLSSDGEKPNRFRDQEFDLPGKTSRDEVMRWWEQGWSIVFSTVDSLKPEDVLAYRNHPAGAAHGDAGAQPRPRALCPAHRTDHLPRQAPPLLAMANAEYPARQIRGV